MLKVIGRGEHGTMYKGVTGQEAVKILLKLKEGEIHRAFYRKEIGSIDLIYGTKEYGLKHIVDKHGVAIAYRLHNIIKEGNLTIQTDAKISIIETYDSKVIVKLDWFGAKKTWIVTSYEKYLK